MVWHDPDILLAKHRAWRIQNHRSRSRRGCILPHRRRLGQGGRPERVQHPPRRRALQAAVGDRRVRLDLRLRVLRRDLPGGLGSRPDRGVRQEQCVFVPRLH